MRITIVYAGRARVKILHKFCAFFADPESRPNLLTDNSTNATVLTDNRFNPKPPVDFIIRANSINTV